MPCAVPQSESSDLPSSVSFPLIFRSQIDNCQFAEWYPKYKRFSPQAKIIKDLPKEFIEYLLADGIILPPDESDDEEKVAADKKGKGATSAELDARHGSRIRELDSNINSNIDTVFDDDDSDDDESVPDPSIKFKPLHREIRQAIKDLGGTVVPKLNWSTPKDAVWMTLTNSLKCTSPSDVYLLLKSSDFITHDLTEPYSGTVEANAEKNMSSSSELAGSTVDPPVSYALALRKNFDVNPALEFRCFVKSRVLVGISQREHLNYYSYLDDLKDSLGYEIEEFFENHLQSSFPDDNFVFDVYIPAPHDRVFLMDINPWAPTTDPLLFTWYELLSIPNEELRPGHYTNKSKNGSSLSLDRDATHMTTDTNNVDHSAPIPIRNNSSRTSLTSSTRSRNESPESLGSMRLLNLDSRSRASADPPSIASNHASSSSSPHSHASVHSTKSPAHSATVSVNNSPRISEISSDVEIYEYEFRLVAKEQGSNDLLGGRVQHSENRVPKDIVDASMTGQGIAEIAKQWSMAMNGETQEESDSDESD